MENSRQRNAGSHRFPLVALLAAVGVSSVLACSDDDEGDSDTEARSLTPDPVAVPEPGPSELPPPAPGGNTPNGLQLPADMADWRVLGVVNVPGDTPTVRVVLGNDVAVNAARAGEVSAWPEGSMIGHLQWSAGSNPDSGTAVVPGDFARLTLMQKNSERYARDGGWAYGVWQGEDLVPPADRVPGFDRACVDCHTASVADQDYVFTVPGALPSAASVAAAPAMPNGVELPAGILNWRVIGVASREADMNPNIRVIIGNDIAVEAARSGETNPWPEGTMLGHYVWAAGENPAAPDAVSPVGFNAITLMVKDSVEYAEDGGWAYGAWNGAQLTAPADPEFDQACVDCHTNSVADKDYVFTIPGAIPDRLINP